MSTIVGVFGLFLENSYRNAWLNAENALERTASVTENIINRHFLQIDSALTSIPVMISTYSRDNGGEISRENAQRLLGSLNFQTFVFMRSDAGVTKKARSGPRHALATASRLSLPMRLADGSLPPAGISSVIGPQRNVMTGQWSLYLVRPVSIPENGPALCHCGYAAFVPDNTASGLCRDQRS